MSAGLRAGTNNDGYIQINGTDVLTALSSGRVGIGTANPATNLHIRGGNAGQLTIDNAGQQYSQIIFANNGVNKSYFNFDNTNSLLDVYTNAGVNFTISAGGNEKVRVMSSGNVGIATTNPATPLDIRGKVLSVTSGTPTGTYNFNYNAHANTGNAGLQVTIGSNYSYFLGTSTDITLGSDQGTTGIKLKVNRNCPDDSLVVDSSGNLTLGSGNLVLGTSGKGIDFSAFANASGMTSELLNDYEQGTWTPELREIATDRGPTYAYRSGSYTRIGNLVYIRFGIKLSNKGTGSGGGVVRIYGLPFTSISYGAYQEPSSRVAAGELTTASNATSILFYVAGLSNNLEGRIANNGDTQFSYTELTNTTFLVGNFWYHL